MNALRLTAAMLATLALTATGCARVQSALTPEPTVVTVEATVATPEATLVGTLAPGFPDDVPLWPGATVTDSAATDNTYDLTLSASEPFADVLAGMAQGFADAGWEVAQDEAGETGARSAILTVSSSSAEGLVTLTENTDFSVSISYVLSEPQR